MLFRSEPFHVVLLFWFPVLNFTTIYISCVSGRVNSILYRFLEIVIQRKTLSWPQAIAKITSEPARKFGLKGRGLIAEGNQADLVLLSHHHGIHAEHVFVAGELAVKDRHIQGKLAGKILKKT